MGGSVPNLLEDTAYFARGPLSVGTVLRLSRFGKPHQCHFLLQVMTPEPGWAADACSDRPFPASRWTTPSSARRTLRSAPVQGFAYLQFCLIIAIMFSAHRHLHLLIWDLGHFLIVSFKLGSLWIAESPWSNFFPAHCAPPSPPSLISGEAGESAA